MIFSERMIWKIFAEDKVETRRILKPGEERCRYEIGRTYAIQPGRGESSVGRIMVLETWRERLMDVCEETAVREGFSSRIEFEDYWKDLHGEFDPEREIWVIRFKLTEIAGLDYVGTKAEEKGLL